MDTMPKTFVLSIEDTPMHSFQYGWNLGTIVPVAKQCAEDVFHNRVKLGHPTVTVALLYGGRIFDTYDGNKWASEYGQ